MAENRELQPDEIFLEKFKIIEFVTTGSLGEKVYKAENISQKRPVFIRVLPADMADDKEFVDRFFQEIKITSFMNHPNILKAMETGKEGDCHYFVTTYSPGKFLDQYLKTAKKMDESSALKLIHSLAEALNYAWRSNKILHRHIAPASIIINHKKEGVLADFGLAKRLSSKMKSLTMAGTTVGRPEYMSPEQFDVDLDIDFRADTYCLGLVFYLILTGHHPFEKYRTPGELIQAHTSEVPEPITNVDPDISTDIAAVIDKMLKKNREERYSNWEAFIEDIEAIQNDEPPPSFNAPANTANDQSASLEAADQEGATSGSKAPTILIIIIAIIVLIIFGVGIAIMMSSG